MGKIAFVFSGQGAQYPGMGQSLAEASSAAKAVFNLAGTLRPAPRPSAFLAQRRSWLSPKTPSPAFTA